MMRFLEKPQLILLFVGSWLMIVGLVGSFDQAAEPKVQTNTNRESNRIKVVPAPSQPSAVINQLQGAGNLQSQGESSLQESSNGNLQKNSGLADFPENSSPGL